MSNLCKRLAAIKKRGGMEMYMLGFGLAGAAVFLPLLYFFSPSEGGIFPPCPTHYLTGLYCPGCGTLRALHALVHLDFAEAFSQNALMVIFIPILPIMILYPEKFSGKYAALSIFIIFIAYAVARNSGIWPFSLLAPH